MRKMRDIVAAAALACLPLAPLRAGADVHVLDLSQTAAAGMLSIDVVPPVPRRNLSDVGGVLSAERRGEIERQLAEVNDTALFLVIQEGELPAPVDVYGNELLRRWTATPRSLAALVLDVAEPVPKTHILFAGRDLSSSDIQQLHGLGTATLGLLQPGAPRGEAAAQMTLDLIPALDAVTAGLSSNAPLPEAVAEAPAVAAPTSAIGVARPDAPTPVQPSPKNRWELVSAKINWSLLRLVAGVLGGALVTIAAVILLPRLLRNRRIAFPDHLPRRRFSAPFAGGSNAQVQYGGTD